jgi:hypothetical protein
VSRVDCDDLASHVLTANSTAMMMLLKMMMTMTPLMLELALDQITMLLVNGILVLDY